MSMDVDENAGVLGGDRIGEPVRDPPNPNFECFVLV
jgi:hypothetical protein